MWLCWKFPTAVRMRVLQSLVIALLSLLVTASPIETPQLKTIKANGQFANNMYRILSKEDNEENVVFSPFSAHACLSMLYQGVSGPFLQDFADTLKVPDPSTAAEGYKSIMGTLNSSPNVTLHVANKAYAGLTKEWIPEFQKVVQEKFYSEVESINFGDLEGAAKIINKWVEDKTHGKIDKLFEPGDLVDAVFALVNSIYFKGTWKYRFSEKLTTSEAFFTDSENQINVDTMHLKNEIPYKESDTLNAKIVELRYSNQDFSMILVLPNEKNGIADLEAKIVDTDLNDITQGLHQEEVHLSLPKFKFEKSLDLIPILKELGLRGIFAASPYIDGVVTDGDDIFISKAIQKVVIQVDEEGSEAAAVTAIVGAQRSSPAFRPQPKVFQADHPFLFFLTHRSSEVEGPRNILFYGKVGKPVFG